MNPKKSQNCVETSLTRKANNCNNIIQIFLKKVNRPNYDDSRYNDI